MFDYVVAFLGAWIKACAALWSITRKLDSLKPRVEICSGKKRRRRALCASKTNYPKYVFAFFLLKDKDCLYPIRPREKRIASDEPIGKKSTDLSGNLSLQSVRSSATPRVPCSPESQHLTPSSPQPQMSGSSLSPDWIPLYKEIPVFKAVFDLHSFKNTLLHSPIYYNANAIYKGFRQVFITTKYNDHWIKYKVIKNKATDIIKKTGKH